MELLVVVLIIGILAAVALPQYQKTVLKSRFSSLMPIAKAVADSNEVYYMEHGSYASEPTQLDINAKTDKYSDGTKIDMDNGNYSYVLAKRDDLPMSYVVYQKHSVQFPGEVHCEADSNDTKAQDVCKSFGATEDIGQTLTPGYITYILTGEGNKNTESELDDSFSYSSEPFTPTLPEYNTITAETVSGAASGVVSLCRPVDGQLKCDPQKHSYFIGYYKTGLDENNQQVFNASYDRNGKLRGFVVYGSFSASIDENGQIYYIDSMSEEGFSRVRYDSNGTILQAQKDNIWYTYYEDGSPFTENAPDISSIPSLDMDSLSWLNDWKTYSN